MTESDKKEIGAILSAVLADHPLVCPHGIDADTAAVLRAFAKAVKDGKKITFKVIWTSVILGVIGLIAAGIRHALQTNYP